MPSVFRKDAVEIARAEGESGYQSNGHWNKYAERLDKCDFFAGCGKKNGAVDHCAISVCYNIFMAVSSDDGSELTDNDRKYLTHYAMYQSDSCCTAAGCTQQEQVYKKAGAWYENPKDLQTGDQIFFHKSNGVPYHTGQCVDWDNGGCFVEEANVEGGKTKIRYYSYSEFGGKIGGFGRPRWDGYERATQPAPEENKENINVNAEKPAEAKPEPVATGKTIDELAREVIDGLWGNGQQRANKLTDAGYDYQTVQNRVNEIYGIKKNGKTYTVKVNTKLNVRYGAGTEHPIKRQLNNGDKVTVIEESNGFGRIGNGEWVCMDYLV